MAQRRAEVRMIREIFRLDSECGYSDRKISQICGKSRPTVKAIYSAVEQQVIPGLYRIVLITLILNELYALKNRILASGWYQTGITPGDKSNAIRQEKELSLDRHQ